MLQALVYGELDQWLVEHQGRDIAMLTEFMQECNSDLRKWSDSVLKTAVAESEHNKTLIQKWIEELLPQVKSAFEAWANLGLEQSNVDRAMSLIAERCKRAGLLLNLV